MKQGRLIASTPLSFVMSLPMTVLNCLCCSLLLLHSGLATSAANPTIAETWLTNFVATLVLMLFLSPFAFVHILLDYHFWGQLLGWHWSQIWCRALSIWLWGCWCYAALGAWALVCVAFRRCHPPDPAVVSVAWGGHWHTCAGWALSTSFMCPICRYHTFWCHAHHWGFDGTLPATEASVCCLAYFSCFPAQWLIICRRSTTAVAGSKCTHSPECKEVPWVWVPSLFSPTLAH